MLRNPELINEIKRVGQYLIDNAGNIAEGSNIKDLTVRVYFEEFWDSVHSTIDIDISKDAVRL